MEISMENNQAIAKSLNALFGKLTKDVRNNGGVFSRLQEDYDTQTNYEKDVLQSFTLISDLFFQWEQTEVEGLNGLKPGEYIKEISSLDQLVELISAMDDKLLDFYPPVIHAKIKSYLQDKADEVLELLKQTGPDESGSLSRRSLILLSIVRHAENPAFLSPVLDVLFRLKFGQSDIRNYEYIQSVLRDYVIAMGPPAFELLMERCALNAEASVEEEESSEFARKICIIALASVQSAKGNEQVFRLIKDSFRKSHFKLMESLAFQELGDGRAILPIRGYLKRECHGIAYIEYNVFRDIITSLGGQIEDIDAEYGYAYKKREYEHSHQHHHHHHHHHDDHSGHVHGPDCSCESDEEHHAH